MRTLDGEAGDWLQYPSREGLPTVALLLIEKVHLRLAGIDRQATVDNLRLCTEERRLVGGIGLEPMTSYV